MLSTVYGDGVCSTSICLSLRHDINIKEWATTPFAWSKYTQPPKLEQAPYIGRRIEKKHRFGAKSEICCLIEPRSLCEKREKNFCAG